MNSTRKRKAPMKTALAEILRRLDNIEKLLSRNVVSEVEVNNSNNEHKKHYSPYFTVPAMAYDDSILDKI